MTHTAPWRAGPSMLVAAILACDSGETPRSADAAVHDSSGVTIVTNADHDWEGQEPWRLSDQPSLSIGEVEGADEYQLYGVTAALRLQDGTIVVANGGTQELRFYDSNGGFLRAAGGQGSGPGEFAGISIMQRYRVDSLMVFDAQVNQFSVFSQTGAFGRSGRVEAPSPDQPLAMVLGSTENGALIVSAMNPLTATGQGATRAPQYLYAHDPDGGRGTFMGEFPGFEFYRGSGPMSFGAVPFGRMTILSGYRDGVMVGSTDHYELRVLDSDGALRRVIRKDHPPRAVEAEHIDQNKRERRERLADVPEMFRQAQEDLIDEIPFPDHFPAFQQFRIDSRENVWVEDYSIPGVARTRYLVFDADGVLMGPVDFPDSFRVLDIGEDYVLGIHVDDLEVEHMQLYELFK